MKEPSETDDAAAVIDAAADTTASAGKSKGLRRKSGAVPEQKKKLNKKASKAKLTHTNVQPGDYFFIRMKGFPLWPGIIADESMLPSSLLDKRPVGAAKANGDYNTGYGDGEVKVKDRKYPVMFLHTNEL